ncbi:MAG: PadR family transcriptional regulator [Vicinamibacteria bacterium]
MAQDNLGQLEQLVMLAIGRLGDEADGAAIQKMLEDEAGREAAIATIYVTLVRLEGKGYVRSRRGSPTPVRGGKWRRYFRLTPKGVGALKDSHAVLARMWRSVSRLSEFKAR